MKTVSLSRCMIHSGSLILINREYPICDDLCKRRLVPVSKKAPLALSTSVCEAPRLAEAMKLRSSFLAHENDNSVLLELRTATVLQNLLDDAECRDEISLVSGFRSEHEQTDIYHASLRDNGAEFTAKYVMLPNHSEHQSGLAIDLALNLPDIDFIRPYFPYTGVCKTFRSKAIKTGFIERYPEGKESVTGIAHEPWHFRYVGAPHSKIMSETCLTLEEYLLWLREFQYGRKPLRYKFYGSDIEIFYLPARDSETFEIDEGLPFTVSGDNMDGFIITVWRYCK